MRVNPHRGNYETVAQYLKQPLYEEGISDEVKARMIAEDSVVELQIYPETPVGFCLYTDSSVERVIAEAQADAPEWFAL